MVNDLGLTFGRASLINANDTSSVNLREWTATPIWKGLLGCVGNLPKSLSGTLKDPPISDDGRRFLAGLLLQLSDQQLRALFSVAHMDARTVTTPESGAVAASVDDWVRAFTAKRDEIVQRRCFDTWSSTAPPGFGVEPNVWLQMRATPGRTNAMNAVSFLGYNAVYVVLAVALTVTWRLRAGAALLVLLALNGMVTNAAKSVVAYPRPDAVDTRVRTIAMLAPVNVEAARQGVVKALPERTIGAVANALDTAPSAPTVDDNVYGFPSGHVSAAAAFLFGLVFFFGWRWAWLGMAIWVPLMAVSRLYLGRHFAADVLGGFAVSVIVTALAVMALNLARLARGTKEYRVRHVGRRLVITAAMLAVSALIIGVPRAPDAGTLLGLAIGILPLLRDPGADEVTWPIRLARFAGAAIAFGVVWFGVRFALSALPAWRGPAVDLVAAALPVAVLFPSMLLIGRHVTRGRQPINASSNTAAH